MSRFALAFVALITACQGDETLSGYGAADQVWALERLDDAPWTARATITFPEEGKITGEAPCNSYFATQSAPYPWFEIGPIGATKRACPDLEAEGQFFDALSSMTLSEVSGDVLLLSNDDGRVMEFRAE